MAGVYAQPIPLAEDERRTLASLAEHALEPAGERLALAARQGGDAGEVAVMVRAAADEAYVLARIFAAAHDGVVDVGDPAITAWLARRRDALLALLRDDRAALYDSLATKHAAGEDVAIAQRWRLVDEDLEELALVARLLSDALSA
jgi:hypothetical protein